ncbi:glutaminyl-peptide cyclotransferase [Thermoproteota archaeon]
MKRQHITIMLIILVLIAAISVTVVLLSNNTVDPNTSPDVPTEPEPEPDPEPEPELEPLNYTYQIVNMYDHDENAFTQGLVFDDGVLYEGTGLYGQSTLRRVELETGNVKQLYSLPNTFFGEGLTIFEDEIIQLTWKNNTGFVYNKNSFELLQTFNYSTEGWGLTHNGSTLIMSVGNETLYFLDPETFQTLAQVEVYDEEPVKLLNELEYINGRIYANIWKEDLIVIIDPQTGQVTGRIDLTGLKDLVNPTTRNVLNGIAYDPNEDRLFVTGKKWSKLFEIELISTK